MTKWTIPDNAIMTGCTRDWPFEVEAMVAAALREAADEIEAMRGPVDVPRTDKAVVFDEACDRCIEIILALIPDAGKALDRVVAEAVKAERERCAKVADEHKPTYDGHRDAERAHREEAVCSALEDVAAAIRAQGDA